MTIEPIYFLFYEIGCIGLIWSVFASHKRAMKCIKEAKEKRTQLFFLATNFLDSTDACLKLFLDLKKEKLKVRILTNPSIKIDKACYRYFCNLCNESHFEILDINENFTGKCTNNKSKN